VAGRRSGWQAVACANLAPKRREPTDETAQRAGDSFTLGRAVAFTRRPGRLGIVVPELLDRRVLRHLRKLTDRDRDSGSNFGLPQSGFDLAERPLQCRYNARPTHTQSGQDPHY